MSVNMMDYNLWGIIPTFLSLDDPRSASEQFDTAYIGGFKHFEGFKVLDAETMEIEYAPDGSDPNDRDEPMMPLDRVMFRDEELLIYEAAWVMVKRKDGSFTIARMD